MDNLTGFQRDLLFVIAGFDRPSGQDVGTELGKYYDQEINYGRLYPNLDALVEEGLVDKGQIDRRTNSYTITEEGRQAIRDRRDWEEQFTPELVPA